MKHLTLRFKANVKHQIDRKTGIKKIKSPLSNFSNIFTYIWTSEKNAKRHNRWNSSVWHCQFLLVLSFFFIQNIIWYHHYSLKLSFYTLTLYRVQGLLIWSEVVLISLESHHYHERYILYIFSRVIFIYLFFWKVKYMYYGWVKNVLCNVWKTRSTHPKFRTNLS